MTRATQAHINLAALRHNFELVRLFAPTQKIMPVIKANAYGHGMTQVAKALPHADAFAVAIIDEAVELREAGIRQPITVLHGASNREELQLAEQLNFDLVVHQLEQVKLLENTHCAKPFVIWLKLDTGMHRLGIAPEQFQSAYQRLQASPNVFQVRLMSHFSCADDTDNPMTNSQCQLFEQLTSAIAAPKSLANSAAIMAWPQTHKDWVRPGIMLFGVSPLTNWQQQRCELKPVMTLQSTIIAIKELNPGESIGYGANWIASRPSRIAIIAIGYGDGYPRALPNGTPVLLNGQTANIVGRISMDSFGIDITDLPGAQVGDTVTLWGQGLAVERIAELAKTIPYELLCQISLRVPRDYVEI
ncbi:MAG: alanine racemase [Pseudomonadales bacterium]|nr:alanine racemase [Pseudomonadales bacterium]